MIDIILAVAQIAAWIAGVSWWLLQWIQWPPVLVPFTAFATYIAMYEYVGWRHRRNAAVSPQPDWPMTDMFEYLRSEADLAYSFDDVRTWHDESLKRVRDDLSIGRLAVWGRKTGQPALGATVQISPSYWANNGISAFWDSTLRHSADADHFGDLMVNKRQVITIYPRAALVRRMLGKPTIAAPEKPTRIEKEDAGETHIFESADGRSVYTKRIEYGARPTPDGEGKV